MKNDVHALALHFCFYNFVRIHKTLKMTGVMAADVSQTLWTMEDIVAMVDARAEPPKAGKRGPRGPYKKRRSNLGN